MAEREWEFTSPWLSVPSLDRRLFQVGEKTLKVGSYKFMSSWVMPSKSCMVEPLPFSLVCFPGPAPCCSVDACACFPFLAHCPGCRVHCFGWLSTVSLWSVFLVLLYLLAWKQLEKCRCFAVEQAGRCSMYRSSVLVGYFPFLCSLQN